MKTAITYIGNILYTGLVIFILGFALLFVGTKVDILGYEVKVVQSGSMEPAIPTGSIIVVAPANNYAIGDVVTYGRDAGNRIPVTHRIVERDGRGYNTTYLTKGDANEEADARTVSQSDLIGKVYAHVPYAGHVIEFARTPWGFLLLIGLPALVIILDEIANIVWEIHKYRFRKRGGKVGYRTPSRERRPRDFTPKTPKRPEPQPPKPRAPRAQALRAREQEFVLDLRHYRFKQNGV